MIVNLRGTSGSGKSHIVRQIMDLHGGKDAFTPEMMEGRRLPVGYLSPNGRLYIPGHYETPCGGCDTFSKEPIKGMDAIFSFIRQKAAQYNVLFEGLLMSEEVRRTVQLSCDFPAQVMVFEINLSGEECLAAINSRRLARNPEAQPVNPHNTLNRRAVIHRAVCRLTTAGVGCRTGSRDEVLTWTKECLA